MEKNINAKKRSFCSAKTRLMHIPLEKKSLMKAKNMHLKAISYLKLADIF